MNLSLFFDSTFALARWATLSFGLLFSVLPLLAQEAKPRSSLWHMNAARSSHAMVLLPDGRVLATGGSVDSSDRNYTNSVEIWENQRWSTAAPMAVPHWDHSMALIPDGRVLVYGGGADSSFESAPVELWDPKTDRWKIVMESLPVGAVPRGMEFIFLDTIPDEFDGETDEVLNATTTVRAVHIETGRSRELGHLNRPLSPQYRQRHLGVLSNGNLFVISRNGAEIFNPETGNSERCPDPSSITEPEVFVLPGDRIIIVGNLFSVGQARVVQQYDPSKKVWKTLGGLPTGAHHVVPLINGKILFLFDSNPNELGFISAVLLDPIINRWSPIDAPVRSILPVVIGLEDGRALATGSIGIHHTRDLTEILDPRTGIWSVGPDLLARDHSLAAALPDGGLMVVGGGLPGNPSLLEFNISVQVWDHLSQVWKTAHSLPGRLTEQTLTTLPNGDLVVFGTNETMDPQLIGARYGHKTGEWQKIHLATTSRLYEHSATVLSDGRVLLFPSNSYFIRDNLSDPMLWNPANGDWKILPGDQMLSFIRPGHGHRAVSIANGRVAIHASMSIYDKSMLCIYDVNTGQLDKVVEIPDRERYFAALVPLPDNRILVMGSRENKTGRTQYFNLTLHNQERSPDIFDVAAGSVTKAGWSQLLDREIEAGITPGGCVVAVAADGPPAPIEVWRPDQPNKWYRPGPLAVGHLVSAEGRFFVVGGPKPMEITVNCQDLRDAPEYELAVSTPVPVTPATVGSTHRTRRLWPVLVVSLFALIATLIGLRAKKKKYHGDRS